MSRLPPRPELSWSDDGTPVDNRVGDVYFSRQDGLEETRTVFLKGCSLPERWEGTASFTIAELGFGTGLNFLAAWQLWNATRPAPTAWLHFVSFEGYPLDRADARRALSAWPELSGLAEKLAARWPERVLGVQRLVWPDDGVTLTLHIGPVSQTLPQSKLLADAWFLDGFSPARNAEMWDAALWPEIRARCRQDASLATFTVAGFVRRGLQAAGFTAAKVPGHGRKRERLEVTFPGEVSRAADPYGLRPARERPDRVRIIGAGIAGACLARTFLDRSIDVDVVDTAPSPAAGASGNRLALVMPRLDAGDTIEARFLIDAYLAARHFYSGRGGVTQTNVTHRSKDTRTAERMVKILADPPLGLETLEALADGVLHKGALIIEPVTLIEQLLDGANILTGKTISLDALNDDVTTIIATGHSVRELVPWLSIAGRLGQVEHAEVPVDAPPSAIVSGHYALAIGQQRLWGATFEDWDGRTIETTDAARAENMAALAMLDPYWRQMAGKANIESRAGVRATTPDQFPFIGAVPDRTLAADLFDGVRHGQTIDADAPLVSGLYISGGLGTRGFTWAPWAAEILASQLLGEPSPAPEAALRAVSPMRQIFRDLKRGR